LVGGSFYVISKFEYSFIDLVGGSFYALSKFVFIRLLGRYQQRKEGGSSSHFHFSSLDKGVD